MANWEALAAEVDAAVDSQWAERVVLRPWQKSEFLDGIPDTSRSIVSSVGIYMSSRARPVGPGYVGRGGVSQPISGRALEADVWLSIRQAPVDNAKLRAGDRVEFPERNETLEVSYIGPSATARPIISLVRLRE